MPEFHRNSPRVLSRRAALGPAHLAFRSLVRQTFISGAENSRRLASISLRNKSLASGTYEDATPLLTGSGSQTEFAVTHSKQTTAPILTGSRIARRRTRPVTRGITR